MSTKFKPGTKVTIDGVEATVRFGGGYIDAKGKIVKHNPHTAVIKEAKAKAKATVKKETSKKKAGRPKKK